MELFTADDSYQSIDLMSIPVVSLAFPSIGIFAERELCDSTEVIDIILPPELEEVVTLSLAKIFFTALYQFRRPIVADLPDDHQAAVRGLLLLSQYLGLHHYPSYYQWVLQAK